MSSRNNRLNILIIPCTEWLKGSQQRLHHLAREWSKRNNVSVFYLERYDDVDYKGHNEDRLQYSSIIRIPTLRLRNYAIFLLTNFVIQAIFIPKIIKQKKIDVVIAEGLGPSNAALFASKITRRRFAFDFSDSYSSFVASYVSNGLLKKILEYSAVLMTNINVHFSDVTVIVNDQLLEKSIVGKEKIVNGVSEDYFPLDSVSDLKDADTVIISFMGTIESWVDFESVMDAIATLNAEGTRKYVLKIIGDGSKLRKLKKMVCSKGLAGSVLFTGWVPYNSLHEYIRDSDICILPFDTSAISKLSMPMKIHEYAISKKAIITTPLPEVKKIYGSAVLYANTPTEYIHNIKLLLENRELKSRLIEDAYKIAKTYSWKSLAMKYERLLYNGKLRK